MTDEALMRAVRDGDLGKLGMLFERHHVALFDFPSAARHARIPAPTAEVDSAFLVLNTPAARLIASCEERLLLIEEVEAPVRQALQLFELTFDQVQP